MLNEVNLNFGATANATLTKLDKGLRSCRLGDESQAIVKFPELFAEHPFPILINSACLKLAELFKNCSNFSRLLILRVLQQTEKHLEKILNLDEFIRRITTVCYSNDPVARAITLRVLGSIACVASQRKHLHHAIRNSLDSTDEIEMQAAIEAAALFAKKSPEFALSIYPKILSILNTDSTSANVSVETKIKLLSVLHHEHYNSEISKDVRERCLVYLNNNETDYFISSALHTLTYISITSLTDVPDQIEILLNYYKNKSNMRLKHQIIKELQLLTKTSPHFWVKQNIVDFISILNNSRTSRNSSSSSLICGLLIILEELIKCPCLLANDQEYLKAFNIEAKQFCLTIMDGKTKNALDRNKLTETANCIRVMTELARKSEETNKETIDHLSDFLCSTALKLEDHNIEDCIRSCKLILKCVVRIANQSDGNSSQKLIDLLCSVLTNKRTCNRMISLVCETLCAIQHKSKNNPNLIKCVRQLMINNRKLNDRSFVSLCTVYFQLTSLTLDKNKNLNLKQLNLDDRCAWLLFKLVRQTMRYGHHEISLELCDKLQYHASNENLYFWFMGLLKISEAECSLIQMTAVNKEDNILRAIEFFSESLSFLKASVLTNYPQNFACELIKLRSKFLHNNLMLIKFCKMIRSSPAASISNLIALNSRDDILKCGSIVNQMRENCKEFRKLAESYGELYQNSFNADQNTLTYLQLLQNCSRIMAEAIESVFHANRVGQTQVELTDFCLETTLPEHFLLKKTCNEVRHQIRTKLYNQSPDSKLPVQTSNLLEISDMLLKIPIVIPRYFFQPLQNTVLKLAISTKPKLSSEQSVVIYANTNFAFKIEGLIKNTHLDEQSSSHRRGIIREVKQILIQVTSVTKSNLSFFDFDKRNEGLKLQSIVEPHNDYFQEQFLLNLKTGYHQINVEAFVIDSTYAQWNLLGASSSLNVKVLEQT